MEIVKDFDASHSNSSDFWICISHCCVETIAGQICWSNMKPLVPRRSCCTTYSV